MQAEALRSQGSEQTAGHDARIQKNCTHCFTISLGDGSWKKDPKLAGKETWETLLSFGKGAVVRLWILIPE